MTCVRLLLVLMLVWPAVCGAQVRDFFLQSRTGTSGAMTTIKVPGGNGKVWVLDASGNLIPATLGTGLTLSSGTLTAGGGGGTVTSVAGAGTVNGLTFTGTVTSTGSLTLGGTLQGTSGAYDATSWNGDSAPPTKDAVRDKIESLATVHPLVTTEDNGSGYGRIGLYDADNGTFIYFSAGPAKLFFPDIQADSLTGNGSQLTNLNAGNIISGTLGAARLPAPQTTALGGVMRNVRPTGGFVMGINSSGQLEYEVPAGGGSAIANPLVVYVRTNGNDGTGEVGNPAKPFATGNAAWTAAIAAGASSFDFGVGTFTLNNWTAVGAFVRGAGANLTTLNVTRTGTNGVNGAAGTAGIADSTPEAANGGNGGNATTAGQTLPLLQLFSDRSITLTGTITPGQGGNGGAGGDSEPYSDPMSGDPQNGAPGNGGNGTNGGGVSIEFHNVSVSTFVVNLGLAGIGGGGGVHPDEVTVGSTGGDGSARLITVTLKNCVGGAVTVPSKDQGLTTLSNCALSAFSEVCFGGGGSKTLAVLHSSIETLTLNYSDTNFVLIQNTTGDLLDATLGVGGSNEFIGVTFPNPISTGPVNVRVQNSSIAGTQYTDSTL